MRFWDSSALVPLAVDQAASAIVDTWLAEDGEVAVWTLTPIELASAVMRLLREKAIREHEATDTEARIDELLGSCHTIINVEEVKLQARRLLRLHPLRPADAMQLEAALEWAAGRRPIGSCTLSTPTLAAPLAAKGFASFQRRSS